MAGWSGHTVHSLLNLTLVGVTCRPDGRKTENRPVSKNNKVKTAKQRDSLVKAFITYVRPVLEYNSPVWSPTLKKDVICIEAVPRKFTKRIPGMSGLSYHSRLKALNLECLELRRLLADLLLTYKILFHLLCLNSEAFFTLRNRLHLRGHPYVLDKQRYFNVVRR